MPQGETHVVMSSWIAIAGLCGWKFRLGLVFGVPGSGGLGSLAGLYVHKVLARSGGAIERVWASRGSQSEIATRLDREIEPIRGETLGEWKSDLEDRFELVDFEAQELIAGARLNGMIEKVVAARSYVLGCLTPDRVQTITQEACYRCERPEACGYYKDVERLHRSGQLPESEEELRRRIWHRRYAVLDFRQISHRNKFIVS